MDETMILAVCGFAVLCGVASWRMAAGKSRRIWLWTALGTLFNVPGMLLVAALPVHHPAESGAALVSPESPTEPAERIAA